MTTTRTLPLLSCFILYTDAFSFFFFVFVYWLSVMGRQGTTDFRRYSVQLNTQGYGVHFTRDGIALLFGLWIATDCYGY